MKWILGFIGLIAIVLAGGYFLLKRADIPYETLAAKYENAASRYVDLPGGVHMHYRIEGVQNADAPTLLLVHGFSASVQTWEPWTTRLGNEFRLVSIDLPGHGLTRAPAGYQVSIPAYVDAVNAFAHAEGLTHFTFVGNSMGGDIAWHYALAHPEQLDGLVLVDAGGWADGETQSEPAIFKLMRNPVIAPILRDLDNTQLTREGLEKAFFNHSLVTDTMVSRYTELARAPGHREILVQIMLDRSHRDVASPTRLAAIHTPTLIIHGDHDNLIAPSSAHHFNDAIAGSELVVLHNVGHVPQEEAPDQSADAVRAFVHRVHAPAAAAAPAPVHAQ